MKHKEQPTSYRKRVLERGLYFYIPISLLVFGYLGYQYLKTQVYESGYNTAVLDIAQKSLSTQGCEQGVILGLGDEKYTYVKNLQCPLDSTNSQSDAFAPIDDSDFILPHLLDGQK